jgi:PKD repeat protein
VSYEWDFADGTGVQFGKTVTHAFLKEGVFNVTLNVTDDKGQKATDTAEINVATSSSAPDPLVTTVPETIDGKITGEAPLKITFDASRSTDPDRDIENYEWDFTGDGTADQAGSKSSFTYDKPGSYTATLNIRDRAGNVGTQVIKIEATEPGVKAVINANPVEGSVPLIVSFDGSNSSVFDGKIVSYEWDFGDKSPKTITGAKISHKYNAVGSYTVRLKVTSNQSLTAEATTLIYVRDIPLLSCFVPSRTTGLAPLSVNFDSTCSSGAIAKYSWDFGDASTADTRKPTHTFEKPGTYTVVLEVADDKNNVNVTQQVISVEGDLQ